MSVSIAKFAALMLDFQNGGRPPSWILKFSLFFFAKMQIIAYFYVHTQNLVKIGRSTAAYFRFTKWQSSTILDFHIFTTFVKHSNLCLFVRPHAKFAEDRMIRSRVIA